MIQTIPPVSLSHNVAQAPPSFPSPTLIMRIPTKTHFLLMDIIGLEVA